MPSNQIGGYPYYTLEDIWESTGCHLCRARAKWQKNIGLEEYSEQEQYCMHCPLFFVVELLKLYAENLAEYKEMYEDDRR